MRKLFVVLLVVSFVAASFAEMDRTLFTRENRFPELLRPELNLSYRYTELGGDNSMLPKNEADLMTATLMARLQVLPDLTLNADLPYNDYSSDIGSDHHGIGDVTIGASLLAYEDIFDYPFVIPHVDHTFDTGDEDKGLGSGESYTTVGVGVGTVTHDVLHWLLDVGYEVRDKSDNALVVGGSVIWDLSNRFSTLAEVQYRQVSDHAPQDDSYAVRYTGGMVYKATEIISFAAYVTEATKNTDEDMSATLRATLSL